MIIPIDQRIITRWFKPLIGANLLRSIDLLSVGMETFVDNCLQGLEANETRISELVARSLMLVTALAPVIGYDNAAKIAKNAHEQGSTLRESALQLALISAEDFDAHVRAQSANPQAITFRGNECLFYMTGHSGSAIWTGWKGLH